MLAQKILFCLIFFVDSHEDLCDHTGGLTWHAKFGSAVYCEGRRYLMFASDDVVGWGTSAAGTTVQARSVGFRRQAPVRCVAKQRCLLMLGCITLSAFLCISFANGRAVAADGEVKAASLSESTSERGSIFPNYREAFHLRSISATACGPLSLITILKRMDIPLSEADIEKIIGTAGSKGTNLMQLKQLAESYGLYALGVELTAEELKQTGLYAIAHLNHTTFAAVTGYSKKGMQLVYPLKRPVVVSDKRFARGFTGRALLLSKVPFPEEFIRRSSAEPGSNPKTAGLRLSQSTIAVGRIGSVNWEESITLHNDGPDTIEIKVKPCCAGISGLVDPNVLPPGRSGVLTVKGKKSKMGCFSRSVTLITNQKDTKPIKVPIQGYLEPPVFFETPAVKLSNVLQNQRAAAQAPFIPIGATKIDELAVRVPDGAPITAEIHRPAGGQPYVSLNWNGVSGPGWHHYKIHVGPADANKFESQLLFAVEVVPAVEVYPASVIIGDSETAKLWSRHLTFKFNGQLDRNPEHHWTNELFADAIDVQNSTSENGEPAVVLSPMSDDAMKSLLGRWSDLIFRFGSGVSSTARVYVGNKAFVNAQRFVEEGKEVSMYGQQVR